MTRLLATTVLLVLVAAMPAVAQVGPSFDCAKASNAVERAICKTPELAKDDREMTAVYSALAAKLAGPAKDHLAKDQVRWIGNRNRACVGDADEIAACLKVRYATRIENLKVIVAGAYPFISEHDVYKAGKVGKITYSIRNSTAPPPTSPPSTGSSPTMPRRVTRTAHRSPTPASSVSRRGPTNRPSRCTGRAPAPSRSLWIFTDSAAVRTASAARCACWSICGWASRSSRRAYSRRARRG